MKNIILNLFFMASLLTILVVACKETDEPVKGVRLSSSTLTLDVGKTGTITATILPENATNKTVTWESSNTNVAAVDNGVVTAKKEGNATITVKTQEGNKTATCLVTVQLIVPEMVSVEGGTFTMGCFDNECLVQELPQHQVTLNNFKIGKYEVTQREWVAIMGVNPSYYQGDNKPVVQVSWNDVQLYIQKLNELTGKNYRLPTEAEWEFAARGGSKSEGYKYSGSNNLEEVTNTLSSIYSSVGAKKPNELGLYDMSGNVFEYCSDWEGYYTDAAQTNPQGPEDGFSRIIRSGSAGIDPIWSRVSARFRTLPDEVAFNTGFRLAHP